MSTVPLDDRTQILRVFETNLRNQRYYNWNFSLQRQITSSAYMLEVSRTRRLLLVASSPVVQGSGDEAQTIGFRYTFRRSARGLARSTRSTRASGRPTISPGVAPLSWSR